MGGKGETCLPLSLGVLLIAVQYTDPDSHRLYLQKMPEQGAVKGCVCNILELFLVALNNPVSVAEPTDLMHPYKSGLEIT